MAYTQGRYSLLEAGSATGAAVTWPGGAGVFSVPTATFSGATIKLQWRTDGTNWLDVDRSGDTYVTLTAVGAGRFELPPCDIRVFISGGPPSAVTAYASNIGG